MSHSQTLNRSSSLWISLLLAGCSNIHQPYIYKSKQHNNIVIQMYSPHVAGKCYSPEAISANGLLRIEGLRGQDEMAFSSAQGKSIGYNMRDIKLRRPITSEGVKIEVAADTIPEPRIDIQILTFKCDAPLDASKYIIWTTSVNLKGLV
jgi:hypothetical protein